MKLRISIIAVIFVALILIAAGVVPKGTLQNEEESSPWVEIVPDAVDYQKFVIAGPNRVHVARMHRDNPDAYIESSMGQGRLSGGLETVRNMFYRYDGALSHWGGSWNDPGWGGRNDVVVGINGFFYDFSSGIPQSGQVHSSWLSKYFEVNGEAEGFVWKTNGQAFIGECITQSPNFQTITHIPSGIEIEFNGVNRDRRGNELIVYTPQYDTNTLTPSQKRSVEVVVDMTGPTQLLQGGEGVTGFVRGIRDGQGSTPMQFDQVVLSARGDKKDELLDTGIQVGDEIVITQKITLGSICPHPPTIGWGLAYASIGGFPTLLRDGEIPTFTDPSGAFRNPRTAIALDEDFIYFIVVDGRNPGVSVGMTYNELATFIRDTLAANWAINQDGGGSSTMVINGQVVNNTTGNDARCVTSPEARRRDPSKDDSEKIETLEGGKSIYLPSIKRCNFYQRAVANGMMMVVYDPKKASLALNPGQAITTQGESTVRLGPGTNYSAVGTVGPGTLGVVKAHMNGLDGIQAKGHFWWKIGFGNLEGWVPETDIRPFFEAVSQTEAEIEQVWIPFLPEK